MAEKQSKLVPCSTTYNGHRLYKVGQSLVFSQGTDLFQIAEDGEIFCIYASECVYITAMTVYQPDEIVVLVEMYQTHSELVILSLKSRAKIYSIVADPPYHPISHIDIDPSGRFLAGITSIPAERLFIAALMKGIEKLSPMAEESLHIRVIPTPRRPSPFPISSVLYFGFCPSCADMMILVSPHETVLAEIRQAGRYWLHIQTPKRAEPIANFHISQDPEALKRTSTRKLFADALPLMLHQLMDASFTPLLDTHKRRATLLPGLEKALRRVGGKRHKRSGDNTKAGRPDSHPGPKLGTGRLGKFLGQIPQILYDATQEGSTEAPFLIYDPGPTKKGLSTWGKDGEDNPDSYLEHEIVVGHVNPMGIVATNADSSAHGCLAAKLEVENLSYEDFVNAAMAFVKKSLAAEQEKDQTLEPQQTDGEQSKDIEGDDNTPTQQTCNKTPAEEPLMTLNELRSHLDKIDPQELVAEAARMAEQRKKRKRRTGDGKLDAKGAARLVKSPVELDLYSPASLPGHFIPNISWTMVTVDGTVVPAAVIPHSTLGLLVLYIPPITDASGGALGGTNMKGLGGKAQKRKATNAGVAAKEGDPAAPPAPSNAPPAPSTVPQGAFNPTMDVNGSIFPSPQPVIRPLLLPEGISRESVVAVLAEQTSDGGDRITLATREGIVHVLEMAGASSNNEGEEATGFVSVSKFELHNPDFKSFSRRKNSDNGGGQDSHEATITIRDKHLGDKVLRLFAPLAPSPRLIPQALFPLLGARSKADGHGFLCLTEHQLVKVAQESNINNNNTGGSDNVSVQHLLHRLPARIVAIDYPAFAAGDQDARTCVYATSQGELGLIVIPTQQGVPTRHIVPSIKIRCLDKVTCIAHAFHSPFVFTGHESGMLKIWIVDKRSGSMDLVNWTRIDETPVTAVAVHPLDMLVAVACASTMVVFLVPRVGTYAYEPIGYFFAKDIPELSCSLPEGRCTGTDTSLGGGNISVVSSTSSPGQQPQTQPANTSQQQQQKQQQQKQQQSEVVEGAADVAQTDKDFSSLPEDSLTDYQSTTDGQSGDEDEDGDEQSTGQGSADSEAEGTEARQKGKGPKQQKHRKAERRDGASPLGPTQGGAGGKDKDKEAKGSGTSKGGVGPLARRGKVPDENRAQMLERVDDAELTALFTYGPLPTRDYDTFDDGLGPYSLSTDLTDIDDDAMFGREDEAGGSDLLGGSDNSNNSANADGNNGSEGQGRKGAGHDRQGDGSDHPPLLPYVERSAVEKKRPFEYRSFSPISKVAISAPITSLAFTENNLFIATAIGDLVKVIPPQGNTVTSRLARITAAPNYYNAEELYASQQEMMSQDGFKLGFFALQPFILRTGIPIASVCVEPMPYDDYCAVYTGNIDSAVRCYLVRSKAVPSDMLHIGYTDKPALESPLLKFELGSTVTSISLRDGLLAASTDQGEMGLVYAPSVVLTNSTSSGVALRCVIPPSVSAAVAAAASGTAGALSPAMPNPSSVGASVGFISTQQMMSSTPPSLGVGQSDSFFAGSSPQPPTQSHGLHGQQSVTGFVSSPVISVFGQAQGMATSPSNQRLLLPKATYKSVGPNTAFTVLVDVTLPPPPPPPSAAPSLQHRQQAVRRSRSSASLASFEGQSENTQQQQQPSRCILPITVTDAMLLVFPPVPEHQRQVVNETQAREKSSMGIGRMLNEKGGNTSVMSSVGEESDTDGSGGTTIPPQAGTGAGNSNNAGTAPATAAQTSSTNSPSTTSHTATPIRMAQVFDPALRTTCLSPLCHQDVGGRILPFLKSCEVYHRRLGEETRRLAGLVFRDRVKTIEERLMDVVHKNDAIQDPRSRLGWAELVLDEARATEMMEKRRIEATQHEARRLQHELQVQRHNNTILSVTAGLVEGGGGLNNEGQCVSGFDGTMPPSQKHRSKGGKGGKLADGPGANIDPTVTRWNEEGLGEGEARPLASIFNNERHVIGFLVPKAASRLRKQAAKAASMRSAQLVAAAITKTLDPARIQGTSAGAARIPPPQATQSPLATATQMNTTTTVTEHPTPTMAGGNDTSSSQTNEANTEREGEDYKEPEALGAMLPNPDNIFEGVVRPVDSVAPAGGDGGEGATGLGNITGGGQTTDSIRDRHNTSISSPAMPGGSQPSASPGAANQSSAIPSTSAANQPQGGGSSLSPDTTNQAAQATARALLAANCYGIAPQIREGLQPGLDTVSLRRALYSLPECVTPYRARQQALLARELAITEMRDFNARLREIRDAKRSCVAKITESIARLRQYWLEIEDVCCEDEIHAEREAAALQAYAASPPTEAHKQMAEWTPPDDIRARARPRLPIDVFNVETLPRAFHPPIEGPREPLPDKEDALAQIHQLSHKILSSPQTPVKSILPTKAGVFDPKARVLVHDASVGPGSNEAARALIDMMDGALEPVRTGSVVDVPVPFGFGLSPQDRERELTPAQRQAIGEYEATMAHAAQERAAMLDTFREEVDHVRQKILSLSDTFDASLSRLLAERLSTELDVTGYLLYATLLAAHANRQRAADVKEEELRVEISRARELKGANDSLVQSSLKLVDKLEHEYRETQTNEKAFNAYVKKELQAQRGNAVKVFLQRPNNAALWKLLRDSPPHMPEIPEPILPDPGAESKGVIAKQFPRLPTDLALSLVYHPQPELRLWGEKSPGGQRWPCAQLVEWVEHVMPAVNQVPPLPDDVMAKIRFWRAPRVVFDAGLLALQKSLNEARSIKQIVALEAQRLQDALERAIIANTAFTDQAARQFLDVPTAARMPQGRVELVPDPFLPDLSQIALLDVAAIKQVNRTLEALNAKKVAVLEDLASTNQQVRLLQYKKQLLAWHQKDVAERTRDFQLMKVNREIYQIIKDDVSQETRHQQEIATAERKLEHAREAHQKRLEELRAQATAVRAERRRFEHQNTEARRLVDHISSQLAGKRSFLGGGAPTATEAPGMNADAEEARRSWEITAETAQLKATIKTQTQEIEFLRAEVDRLTRSVYPAFDEAP